MSEISLSVKKREYTTKGALNQLRKKGFVPGIYYAKGQSPILFSVSEITLNPLVFTSETHIISLQVEENESMRCIIKEVQFDPVSDRVVHVDLQGITMGQKLQLQIPVVLVGSAIGVKQGGLLQHNLHKLEVECLPRHIPEHVEIDVTNMNIGDAVHVRDLSYENLEILNSPDATIVAVTVTRATTAEEVSVGEEGGEKEAMEPEVIGKGKAEEKEK